MKLTKKEQEKIIKKDIIYPFFEKYLFRKISIQISSRIYKTQIRGPHIILIGFFVAVIGVWFIAQENYLMSIIGGLILLLAFALDCVDGEVARLKNQADDLGAFLDKLSDLIKEIFVFTALAYHHFLITNDINVWYLLMAVLWTFFIPIYIIEKYKKKFGTRFANKAKKNYLESSEGLKKVIVFIFANIYTPSFIFVLIFFALLLNQIVILFYILIISKIILIIYLLMRKKIN